jgi:hypothetical protein
VTHAAWQVSIQHGIGVAEELISLLGRWTFAFMEPMIRRGMVTQLRDADLPPLTLRDSTEDTTQRLHTAWESRRPGLWWACPTPPPHTRTHRTRRVPHPVLIGHAASLIPY